MSAIIPGLPLDGRRLFLTRMLRLFAYGFLSVVLALYLSASGLKEGEIGLLLTLTLAGDAAISLLLTTAADRFGRRRSLVIGAVLMILAGTVFSLTRSFPVLLAAAIVGVVSPSGYEVGPFLPVEQAGLSQIIADRDRTRIFAWYNLVGSVATAVGSLVGGGLTGLLQGRGMAALASYRIVVLAYAAMGAALAVFFLRMSNAVEAPAAASAAGRSDAGVRSFLGLHRSRGVVARLSALFALDAFAGGFVIQSMVAYWFHLRFGVKPAMLGAIFFGANLLAALSALLASKIASRIGLIRTMVFTHLPSNVLLILVPLMPNLGLAVFVLLIRFSISQMDVPARQSYIMAIVTPDERSAAAGVTGVARTVGASISPSLAGLLLARSALTSFPFFLGGGLKIVYDLLLLRGFASRRPPEER